MRKTLSLFLAGMMTVGLLSGCGQSAPAESHKESESEPAAQMQTEEKDEQGSRNKAVIKSGDAVTVTAWHDNDETMMNTLADFVNTALADQNIILKFEKKSDLSGQIRLYGTDEANGPDMYLFAHDSLGSFAEMGILEPVGSLIGEDRLADLIPMTLEAGSYKGEQYLLPLYYETLLFMYNRDLWEGEVPTETEELYAYMQAHTDEAAGTYALVNQHSNAYNVAPFLNGFGGYVIDQDGNPGLNDQKTKEAITYNKKFAMLQADGDYNTVTALFNEGKAAAIVGGPWLISGIREAGINLGVMALTDFTLPDGNCLVPYSGVQCMGVLKYAAGNKKDAVTKVLEVLAEPETGVTLAKQFNCAPANSRAYEDAEAAQNEMILAMKKSAEKAIPMPNIPEMSAMWGPAESLLAAVNKSGEDVDTAADKYQKEALTAIADMK